MDAIIVPGSTEAAVMAIKMFYKRANPGRYKYPIYIYDLSIKEYKSSREKFKKAGFHMKARYLNEEVE